MRRHEFGRLSRIMHLLVRVMGWMGMSSEELFVLQCIRHSINWHAFWCDDSARLTVHVLTVYVLCHAITVTGQTMNFHDYCHGWCDYWIRVGKCVMVHANTGHGCQGHVLSRFDDWRWLLRVMAWLSEFWWLSRVMRWLGMRPEGCYGSCDHRTSL